MLTTFSLSSVKQILASQLTQFEVASTPVGQLFYATDTNVLYQWNGSSMTSLAVSGDPTGFICPPGATVSIGKLQTSS